MGCTNSNQTGTTKENPNSPPAIIAEDGQRLINEHFQKWLKINRPKADEHVLNDVLLTAQPSNEVEDYRAIIGKALDLLTEHYDIRSTNKLGKLIQKEIALASPKKVAHTIDVLRQTADKLRHGNIHLDIEQHPTTNNEVDNDTATLENKHVEVLSGEPGIGLKEALEKARILFYKGKQAAIFANPNGGYDVRILDDNDETINHDGNLLRSIVVTEVKKHSKPTPTTTSSSFISSPPPPPSLKLLNEDKVTDDFRCSIDAALKGLEVIYITSEAPATSPSTSKNIQNINVDKAAITTHSPPLVIQYGVTNVPIPKSVSKEQTMLSNDLPATNDTTANLAEIIHQIDEQSKIANKQLLNANNGEKDHDKILHDIQPQLAQLVDNTNDLVMDTVEVTTCSQIGDLMPLFNDNTVKRADANVPNDNAQGQIERIVKEMKEHGEKHKSKDNLSAIVSIVKQSSSYSLGLTSPLHNAPSMMTSKSFAQQKPKLQIGNRPKSFNANEETNSKDHFNLDKQTSLDELVSLTRTGLSNPNLTTSVTKLGISASSGKIEEEEQMPIVTAEPLTKKSTSISQIIEEHRPILNEASSTAFLPPPAVTPVDTAHVKVKSPTHNVTYTEIIRSESRDGEQSRHLITESSDQNASNDDEQITTLKVITKSEFSNHPSIGEKIMEQSVQVITVKVRNEMIKTTVPQTSLPSTTDDDIEYEQRPVSELVKNFEIIAASNDSKINT